MGVRTETNSRLLGQMGIVLCMPAATAEAWLVHSYRDVFVLALSRQAQVAWGLAKDGEQAIGPDSIRARRNRDKPGLFSAKP